MKTLTPESRCQRRGSRPSTRRAALPASGIVAWLGRWPVKSFQGEAPAAVLVDDCGVVGDRAHALYDLRGPIPSRLTGRQAPQLLRWAAAYRGVPADAIARHEPPPPTITGPDGSVYLWGDPELRPALREDLARELALVRDPGGQQDLPHSVLITARSSYEQLQAQLARPLDLRRFRTNLHLQLDAPAFAEHGWEGAHLITSQGVELLLCHACRRCAIPTCDPLTGQRWPELLRFLNRAVGGLFGINAKVTTGGRVSLDDRVWIRWP